MWQSYSEIFLGRLAVMGGEDAPGIERMRNGIARWQQAIGMAIGTDNPVMVLADDCLAAAQ